MLSLSLLIVASLSHLLSALPKASWGASHGILPLGAGGTHASDLQLHRHKREGRCPAALRARPAPRQKQGAALDVQRLVALRAQPSTAWPDFAPNPRQFNRGSCGFRRLTAVSRRRTAAATNPQNPAQRCG